MNLTNQEIEIVKLICEQKTNTEIANTLFKSKRTIEHQRSDLMFKIGALNVVGVVLFALRNEIIKL